jgi:hypothetical protein
MTMATSTHTPGTFNGKTSNAVTDGTILRLDSPELKAVNGKAPSLNGYF